jgi:hypothetical protein
MKMMLLHQFDQHFEEVPPDSMETSMSDIASELELKHYMYLYGSETNGESRSLDVLGKEPFAYSWINRPAQYLKRTLGESQVA